MRCPKCQSTRINERPERKALGYRLFRCLDCAKHFNERSGDLLNRTQYPSDLIALVVLWRLRYKFNPRDRTDPRYTPSASGNSSSLQGSVTEDFSPIQSPDAPIRYEKSELGRQTFIAARRSAV
jgi:hypothetical protein